MRDSSGHVHGDEYREPFDAMSAVMAWESTGPPVL